MALIRKRFLAGGALTALLVSGLASAVPGGSVDTPLSSNPDAIEQMDLDVTELPPQVPPPGPGDTDWPFYNRTIDGKRFSDLSMIDTANVGELEEVCRVRLSGPGPLSAGTILVNGMLYVTAAQATIAIEPTNCDVVWKAIYPHDEGEIYNANRGAAQWDGKLYRGTGDGRLVAYDAMTGHELWRVKGADPKQGEYMNAAPLVWDGKVFIGIAAGDLGIRGRMMAFDAKTGEKLWTFNLIPGPGEFGNETWPGDSWKHGGGGTWSTYTLDPATGELFVPVANPAPAFDPDIRKGDNLFTNSAVVLDARTGKYLWHYQSLPNDSHDYGVSPPGILIEVGGRKLLAQASKDGHVYMVDRKSHRLVWKQAVTTMENFDALPTFEGVRVCPGAKGGVEYSSPGYDPKAGLLVVGSVDWCYYLTRMKYGPHVPGQPYLGGRMERGDSKATGWIMALDAKTGKVRWKYETPAPVIGAVTPTAGGITFAGDTSGLLYAFRTSDGKVMHKVDTGGAIAGGIITYRIRGRQYLAVSSGNISRSSWTGATGIPTMIIYSVPETATAGAVAAADVAHGRSVYRASCAVCHGAQGQGGAGPPLKGIAGRYTQDQAVAFIKQPGSGMPKLFPATLGEQDVIDVAAYVRTISGD
ncbi:MAG: PQQ-binding-like beta-propeller repeat protein [Novosphingobium sp.]|nr:PQQ-binding-like beta-propeller repeat protein [Novosphingobium sp.]